VDLGTTLAFEETTSVTIDATRLFVHKGTAELAINLSLTFTTGVTGEDYSALTLDLGSTTDLNECLFPIVQPMVFKRYPLELDLSGVPSLLPQDDFVDIIEGEYSAFGSMEFVKGRFRFRSSPFRASSRYMASFVLSIHYEA
jgi:hypothetical protein